MRKVFSSSSETIHIFAQRQQAEGRSGNVFFENDKIYSYGYHYLLGEFITNKKGDLAIMINDSGYSSTTSKHISWLRSGTGQYKQFLITETDAKSVLSELENNANKLQNAKKPELYINPSEKLYNKYFEFIEWTGKDSDKKTTKKIKKIIEIFRGGNFPEYLKKQAAKIKRDKLAAIKKAKIKLNEDLQKFFDYKINRLYGISEDYIRISQDQKHIESSQQVKVPIAAAKILYKMIKAGKDIKGYRIDNYTVISINGTLKIGCHNINKENVDKIGELILSL